MKDFTNFEMSLLNNAKLLNKTIVLPEAGYSEMVYKAGIAAASEGVAKVIFLIKDNEELNKFNFNADNISANENVKVININESDLLPMLTSALIVKRQNKGLTEDEAKKLLKNEIYFGTLMVELGMADGMVCGAENTTADAIRPALQIIKGKNENSVISSFFIMVSENEEVGEKGVYVLSDCGINENPTASQLVEIVYDTVESTRRVVGFEPRVSLLTYSTHGSAGGEHPNKMREVKEIITAKNPNFLLDGELQFDASIVPSVAKKKAPNSVILGNANVLIFPDLSSGNISYKIMQRLAGFTAIGPICQGFKKPINDVSRGANEKDILLVIAITCLQS